MSHRVRAETAIPRIPTPGDGRIDVVYINQLVAALEDAIDILNASRQRTFPEINLSDLQGHGANLRDGDVFQDGGILKIVRANDAFAASFLATASVGSVTVSTP
jgi:hypothetical protein